MNITLFETLIYNNIGLLFTGAIIIGILIASAKGGVRNGFILYLLTVMATIVCVVIKAISSSFLLYLILPLLILIVFKMIFNGGSE